MRSPLYLKIFLLIIITGCTSTTYIKTDYVEDLSLKKKISIAKKEIAFGSPVSLQKAIDILKEMDLSKNKEAKELYIISYKIMERAYPLALKLEDALSETNVGFYSSLFKEVDSGNFVKLTSENVSYISNMIVCLAVIKTDKQKVLDQCEALIESALKLNRLSVLPYYLYGLIYEKQGMYKEAIENYDTALLIDPSVYAAEIAKARIYLIQEYPSKVLLILGNIEYKSENIEKLKIEALIKQKKNDAALDAVNMALNYYPGNNDLNLLRAKILELIGEGQAASFLIKELDADSNEDEVLLLKARLRYNAGDISQALEILEQGVLSFPDNVEIREFYSKVLIESGKEAEGLRILNELINNNPDRYSALFVLMKYYYDKSEWKEAGKYIAPLLVLENSIEYYEYAYKIYLELKSYSKALVFAETLYENNKDNLFYVVNYIETLISTGSISKASVLINEILKKAEDSELKSQLLHYKAIIASDLQDKINLFDESIYENPLNEKSLKKLSEIYMKQQDYDRALYLLKQLKLINPEDPEVDQQISKLNKILNINE